MKQTHDKLRINCDRKRTVTLNINGKRHSRIDFYLNNRLIGESIIFDNELISSQLFKS